MNVRRLTLLAGAAAASGLLAGAGVLFAEAALTLRRGFLSADTAPSQDGTVGDSGQDLRLAILGGSMAAGVGVARTSDTVGRQLSRRLARRGYRVRLSALAVSGSVTADLGPQVSRALLGKPDVAVVLIGATDATHGSRLTEVGSHLYAAVARMVTAGVPVVVGACPDLGATPAFPQPLRALAGWRGRQLAAVETTAAASAGGVAVDLGSATGAVFRADRGTFSEDGFHPSADGYRLWAEALLPAVAGTAAAPAHL